MCGRFTLIASAEMVAELFQLDETPPLGPRYNIAPTQPVAAVRLSLEEEERQLELFTWGLIPSWAKDISIGSRLINARSETAAEKPSFRAAFKYRRCLIPASGFYEWKRQGKAKQPYYFRLADSDLFAFAGLWERWQGADGSEIQSCTILTTDANDLVRTAHDRMPVIVAAQDYDRWLDPTTQSAGPLQSLLQPFPAEAMTAYPVSSRVNNPRNEEPENIRMKAEG